MGYIYELLSKDAGSSTKLVLLIILSLIMAMAIQTFKNFSCIFCHSQAYIKSVSIQGKVKLNYIDMSIKRLSFPSFKNQIDVDEKKCPYALWH